MATDWQALRKFYVYDLIDPRDLRTFYVGKGSPKGSIKQERHGKKTNPTNRTDRH